MITQDLIFSDGDGTNGLTTTDQNQTLHPVIAYVGSLRSENSQRGMMASLQTVTKYYAELFVIRPLERQDYTSPEAIREAVKMGFLVVQTIKRGKNAGQPKLNKQGKPITIGNPFALDWSQMNHVILQQIFIAMNEANVAPRTINHAIAAVRGVMKKAKSMKLISIDDYDTIVSEIKVVKITTLPKGRDLEIVELNLLSEAKKREAADPTKQNAVLRDLAILAVLNLGLRISEVASLQREHVNLANRKLDVIGGKGRKDRRYTLDYETLRTIQKWVDVRGNNNGPLFLAIHKSGVIQPPKADKNGNLTGMTRQAMTKMLDTLAKTADIAKLSPHDFRRTFIGDLLDAGVDIVTAAELAGHSSIETTRRYDRRGERRLASAIDQLAEFRAGGNQ